MDRRDFLRTAGATGALSLLSSAGATRAAAVAEEEGEASLDVESREAYRELLALLSEADSRWLSPAWGITREADVADGERFLLHLLHTALFLKLEADPLRPVFRRIVTPSRKILGDNPDAVYFEAPVRGDRSYRVRGNVSGAVYTSFTVEAGGEEGGYSAKTATTLNDGQFDVDEEGDYDILVGPDVPEGSGLRLPPDARTVTTRHYFEEPVSVAADPLRQVRVLIEPLEAPPPPPAPDDASIAAAIRRVTRFVRGNTLDQVPPMEREVPSWVSRVPNVFNPPEKPGDLAFAAVDNAYAMAPYVLRPDQALEIRGRFPECRFANVVLWNRFLQSYDYAHRQVSLNRAQTVREPDGSFRIVVAGRDPGVPNWLDTAGRPSGTIYWRFLLPEGEVETPKAKQVPLAELS